jgi:Cytochrome B561
VQLKNDSNSYGWLHVLLHWWTALAVVGLFALGLWMHDLDYYHEWYRTAPYIHKSVGVVLILTLIFRFYWRLNNGVPNSIETHKSWEKKLAKLMHWLFYGLIFSMFFSGYFITTAKGQSLEVLGFIAIPATLTGIENLEDIAGEIHELTAFSIIWLAVLHAVAAIKHHLVDKDRTLLRILGR